VILRRLILGLCLAFAAAFTAAAGDLGPVIPKATGSPHPEGNAYMIRHHMEMMMHDRDLVVHKGQRPAHESIGKCFDCHTVRDASGTPVTFQDPRHFCRTCHDFAAVKIDCFECHRSTPSDFTEPPLHAALNEPLKKRRTAAGSQTEVLEAYLDGVTKKTEAVQ
jgi:hypothetical protein